MSILVRLVMENVKFLEELFGLKGKVAVVLGGTSGIGKAIAIGYAQAGADVVASARRAELVNETVDELETIGARTLTLTSDVQNYESLVALREAVVKEFGRVDVLVVSSGILFNCPSQEMPEEELVRVVDTNLNGTFRASQIFGRQMIEQGGGSIVSISSIAGYRSIVGMAPYSASKAAVISLTGTLAAEWAQFNVRVNGIAPGPFKTGINVDLLKIPGRVERVMGRLPMKRFGETRETVGAALYLGSEASSFVTGATIAVDGGFLAASF